MVADLAGEIDVPVLTARCFESGDIDVVVMAAGITPNAEAETDAELVRRVALVNFVSQMQLGTELVQTATRPRALVVLSSVAVRTPRADNYVYGATKGGLDAWANGLADALIDEPIRDPRRAPRHGAHAHEHQAQSAVHLRPRRRRGSGGEEPSHGPDHRVGPPQLRLLMSGLRHAPRPVFRKASKMR